MALQVSAAQPAAGSKGLAAAVAAAASASKPPGERLQKQLRVEWATPRSLESQFSRTLYVNNIKQARVASNARGCVCSRHSNLHQLMAS